MTNDGTRPVVGDAAAGPLDGASGRVSGGSARRRGLAIGAVIGVAIIGSTVWQRRRVRRRIRRELIEARPASEP